MMLRIPVQTMIILQNMSWRRLKSSSSSIRSTFIEYFTEIYGHKHVKSSSVVPLFDPSVPFVNAGMNQFKGVFLGKSLPPYDKVVNSQKCIRVGGKHNDLETVGLDGYHHTFFEMLGNWSFGGYSKKEACQMAWELLLGPYQLKPGNLIVTYFGGDVVLNLQEDRECRDIWKSIGVPADRLRSMSATDNFWEMGATGPCGPCTEIHYLNADGSLTEIWNIVFIQYNRESNGSVTPLKKQHVDTGMGLERMAALLQNVPSNYDTDLFQPIIKAIQTKSKAPAYTGSMGPTAHMDVAYRRLADHARMVAVCLADGAYPASSLNLKQVMRKSFKISEDVFKYKTGMLSELFNHVAESLGPIYPELLSKQSDAKKIIDYEEEAYGKLRSNLAKKWKNLVKQYPEVESLEDVELSSFDQGYRELKQAMSSINSKTIPGEIVFKLYDTHGFQEHIIERIANINNLRIDKKEFQKLLNQHKSRHKTALKEQNNSKMALCFDKAIEELTRAGVNNTNDEFKYNYTSKGNEVAFEPLKTKLVAMLNQDGDWLDYLETNESDNYYLVTENTTFFCEEGGQTADTGVIRISDDTDFNVDSVFKIRDYVFHKGSFKFKDVGGNRYLKLGAEVVLEIDGKRRFEVMRNHTAIHLLNAAIRKVLPNSVLCQVGSSVSDTGIVLNLSVYGDKLTQKVVTEAQHLVREAIAANVPVSTITLDSAQWSSMEDVVTVPGETYPETGLRLVEVAAGDLVSRELCCGTHVAHSGDLSQFCVTAVQGAGSRAPRVAAIAGHAAEQLCDLSRRARELSDTFHMRPLPEVREGLCSLQRGLDGARAATGATYGEAADCETTLLRLQKRITEVDAQRDDVTLNAIAEAELREAYAEAHAQGRCCLVHFLRCSYLMESARVWAAPPSAIVAPALLLACAGGIVHAACHVPHNYVSEEFTAEKWMSCVLPVFSAQLVAGEDRHTHATMTGTKVSLITCEQLVQDAMRAAIRYADEHAPSLQRNNDPDTGHDRGRGQN